MLKLKKNQEKIFQYFLSFFPSIPITFFVFSNFNGGKVFPQLRTEAAVSRVKGTAAGYMPNNTKARNVPLLSPNAIRSLFVIRRSIPSIRHSILHTRENFRIFAPWLLIPSLFTMFYSKPNSSSSSVLLLVSSFESLLLLICLKAYFDSFLFFLRYA